MDHPRRITYAKASRQNAVLRPCSTAEFGTGNGWRFRGFLYCTSRGNNAFLRCTQSDSVWLTASWFGERGIIPCQV